MNTPYTKRFSHLLLFICTSFVLAACGDIGQTPLTPAPSPSQQDSTAPVISLHGVASLEHPQGTAYVDAGATAVDAIDGTVAVTVSGEVGTALGVYTLTFTASDQAGNTASKTRTVTVIDTSTDTGMTEGDLVVFTNGAVAPIWDAGINAFDAAIAYAECNNDGGAACPSLAWAIVNDSERGDVLEVAHADTGSMAGLFISTSGVVDLSAYAEGSLVFDVKVISGDNRISMKLDCQWPCTSGEQALGHHNSAWETVTIPIATLVAGGLDLQQVNTGLVIWATGTNSTVFRIDNIRFTGLADGATTPTDNHQIQ